MTAARGLAVKDTSGHRPARYVATQSLFTGWPGARSSGGRGLARPVAPGGVSVLAVLVSTCASVVTHAATIAIMTIAKSTKAVPWLFRSLLMRVLHSNRETLCGLDGSGGVLPATGEPLLWIPHRAQVRQGQWCLSRHEVQVEPSHRNGKNDGCLLQRKRRANASSAIGPKGR